MIMEILTHMYRNLPNQKEIIFKYINITREKFSLENCLYRKSNYINNNIIFVIIEYITIYITI
jgi:hypothetical protein